MGVACESINDGNMNKFPDLEKFPNVLRILLLDLSVNILGFIVILLLVIVLALLGTFFSRKESHPLYEYWYLSHSYCVFVFKFVCVYIRKNIRFVWDLFYVIYCGLLFLLLGCIFLAMGDCLRHMLVSCFVHYLVFKAILYLFVVNYYCFEFLTEIGFHPRVPAAFPFLDFYFNFTPEQYAVFREYIDEILYNENGTKMGVNAAKEQVIDFFFQFEGFEEGFEKVRILYLLFIAPFLTQIVILFNNLIYLVIFCWKELGNQAIHYSTFTCFAYLIADHLIRKGLNFFSLFADFQTRVSERLYSICGIEDFIMYLSHTGYMSYDKMVNELTFQPGQFPSLEQWLFLRNYVRFIHVRAVADVFAFQYFPILAFMIILGYIMYRAHVAWKEQGRGLPSSFSRFFVKFGFVLTFFFLLYITREYSLSITDLLLVLFRSIPT